jgi:hypothetical protein
METQMRRRWNQMETQMQRRWNQMETQMRRRWNQMETQMRRRWNQMETQMQRRCNVDATHNEGSFSAIFSSSFFVRPYPLILSSSCFAVAANGESACCSTIWFNVLRASSVFPATR